MTYHEGCGPFCSAHWPIPPWIFGIITLALIILGAYKLKIFFDQHCHLVEGSLPTVEFCDFPTK